MHVIGHDCQRMDLPVLLFDDVLTALGNRSREYGLAPPRTANQLRDDQMHTVLIALVFKLPCIFHSCLYTIFSRLTRAEASEKPA